ncbi:MAG: hypothetical protein F4Y41_12170 [Gammaproteobacteria bacterium]|nr:hypothetical protein [Gammaproteobacteria bacterium]
MKRVLLATASAFAVATAVFVAFVLPAEFGIDPTGVGGALGLTGLGGSPPQDLHPTVVDLVRHLR